MKTPHDVKEKLKTPHNLSTQRNGGTARARGRQRQRTKAPPIDKRRVRGLQLRNPMWQELP
jgi:hypothetical protein